MGSSDAVRGAAGVPALLARSFSVARDGRTVVAGVDLALAPGECAAVIGPNAGGKTSLLLGLRGLLPATGTLSLGGLDPRTAPRSEVARRVAVVPQGNEFAFPIPVREMVLLGRSPYRRPWQGWSAEDRRIAGEWIGRLGLGALADRPVDALSGGERRRVFVARALAQETPLLLLDEPLAGLDPAAREELAALLGALRAERARTMVVVLHDIDRLGALADRVIGIAGGAASFAGTPETLDAPALERLFGVPWLAATRADGARILVPASPVPDAGGTR